MVVPHQLVSDRLAEADLPEVIQATGALSLGLGSRQRGQQQRRQDSNDGNHHQQLDQGET